MSDRVNIDGKYAILKRLGEGGFGTVYLCNDPDLGREIAIKVIRLQENSDSQAKRFLNEGKALAKCKHPGIVKLIKFGITTDGAELYIAMEPLDGRPLSNEIDSNGPLSPRRLLKLFVQVFEALEHAHQNGIIHRDLKPSNIMLCSREGEEQAVLIDFGLMRAPESEVKITATGDMLGTPLYMSPEQCKGVPADHRSDIYSAGCCVYAAATGRPPFDGDGYSVLMDHLKTTPSAIPEYLHEFVSKCMEKDPENRFQSALSAREALVSLEQRGDFVTDVRATEVDSAVTSVSNVRRKSLPVAALVTIVGLVAFLNFNRAPVEELATESAPVSKKLMEQQAAQARNKFTEQIKTESDSERKTVRDARDRSNRVVNSAIANCDNLIKKVRDEGGDDHIARFYPVAVKAEIVGKYSDSQRHVEDSLKELGDLRAIPGCVNEGRERSIRELENRLRVRGYILESDAAMRRGDAITAGKKLDLAVDMSGTQLRLECARSFVWYSKMLKEQGDTVQARRALKRAIEIFQTTKKLSEPAYEAIYLFSLYDLSSDREFVTRLAKHLQEIPTFDHESEIRTTIQASRLYLSIGRTQEYRDAILRGINLALKHETPPKLRAFDAIHTFLTKVPDGSDQSFKFARLAYDDLAPFRFTHVRPYALSAFDLARMEALRHRRKDAIAHYKECIDAAEMGMQNPVNVEEGFQSQLLSVQAMISLHRLLPEAERATSRQRILEAIAKVASKDFRIALTKQLNAS